MSKSRLNQFYDINYKCPWQVCFSILEEKKIKNICFKNGHFSTICGHFFGNYIDIFHKTEIQTVILRCWTDLYLNLWHKMQIKLKNPKNPNAFFSTILLKNGNGNVCILSHNSWVNQGLDLLNTSKWLSESQFCEI